MMTTSLEQNAEWISKAFAFPIQEGDAEQNITQFVSEGKVVGVWDGNFRIQAQADVMEKNPIRWKQSAEKMESLDVPDIKSLWNALDYFAEGELDVLVTSDAIFKFPEEGRRLIDAIRSSNLKTDFDFNSDDPFLNNLQGKLLVLEGKVSEAGKSFGKALSSLPEYSEPYANLGTLLWQLGQKKEAFTLFIEALIRNPHNIAAQLNFFDAGKEMEEFDAMIRVIGQLLEISPDCLEFYPVLAFSYFRSGQAPKAIDILNDFISKHPQEEEAALLLKHIQSKLQ